MYVFSPLHILQESDRNVYSPSYHRNLIESYRNVYSPIHHILDESYMNLIIMYVYSPSYRNPIGVFTVLHIII